MEYDETNLKSLIEKYKELASDADFMDVVNLGVDVSAENANALLYLLKLCKSFSNLTNEDLERLLAEKLDKTDAGSGLNPIYIKDGKAAASTSTAGGGLNPIFLNNGVLTASTATAGDINHGVYLENGVFKATTEARLNDAGGGLNPIYIKDGKAAASTSTAGGGLNPIFLNNGVLTASTATAGGGLNPIYLNNGVLTASTATAGGGLNPIYLNNGTLTASTSTAGAELSPIYLKNGTLTATTATLGDTTHGIYLSNGEFKVTDGTTLDNAGSGVNPIYTAGGKIIASTASVGDADTPIYLSNGTLTATTATIGSNKKPIFLNGGNLTALSETIGGGAKPIYLNAGELTASTSTIGGGAKPIYLNAGELTASTSTIGDADTPIYLNAGTFTIGTKKQIHYKEYNPSNYTNLQEMFNEIAANPPSFIQITITDAKAWLQGATLSLNGSNSYILINMMTSTDIRYSTMYDETAGAKNSVAYPTFSAGVMRLQLMSQHHGEGVFIPVNFNVSQALDLLLTYRCGWFGFITDNINVACHPIVRFRNTNYYQSVRKHIYTNLSSGLLVDFEASDPANMAWCGINSSTWAKLDNTNLYANGSRMNLMKMIPENKINLGVANGGEIIVNTNSNWILQQAANTRTANGVIWQY